jgi:hypothetical protein
MITVNLTFFVQIINFFIAHWMLRRFFMRPVMDYVTSQKKQEHDLVAYVAHKKREIKTQEEIIRHDWHEFHEQMKTLMPTHQHKERPLLSNLKPALVFPTISKATVKSLAHELATISYKKVKDVA